MRRGLLALALGGADVAAGAASGTAIERPRRRVLGHKQWVARNEQNTRERPAPCKEAAGLDDGEQRAPLQRDFSIVADGALSIRRLLSTGCGCLELSGETRPGPAAKVFENERLRTPAAEMGRRGAIGHPGRSGAHAATWRGPNSPEVGRRSW